MQQAAHIPADILKENEELRVRLEEAEDMLRAIRSGDVDALVVESDAGPQVYTLQGQDAEASRLRGEMLEQVSDAVIAVDASGLVTFLNGAAKRLYGLAVSKALAARWQIYFQRAGCGPTTRPLQRPPCASTVNGMAKPSI